MAMDSINRAVSDFCDAAMTIRKYDELQRPAALQRVNACAQMINSFLASPTLLDDPRSSSEALLLTKCQRFGDFLPRIPVFILEMISDVPLLKNDDTRYWYGCALQSVYQCFRSLQISKLLQVKMDFFSNLLYSTMECLIKIHGECNTVNLLLILLRMMYACMAGLQDDDLPSVSDLAKALIPYFKHNDSLVRISARNAAQFLIPVLKESEKTYFILSASDVHDLLRASGRDLPTTSFLKLIIEFSQIPKNCEVFLNEGIFLYSTALLYESKRSIEKNLAFSVMKLLVFHKHNQFQCSSLEPNERSKSLVMESKPTVASVNDTIMALSDQLAEKMSVFISIPISVEIRNIDFQSVKHLFEKLCKLCQSNRELDFTANIESTMLKYILGLVKVITLADENQLIRWCNLIIIECWGLFRQLGGKNDDSHNAQRLSSFIETLLPMMDLVLEKLTNEVIMISLSLCFDILEDILVCCVTHLEYMPLAFVKKCFLNAAQVLKNSSSFKFRIQIILCLVINSEQPELNALLTAEKKSICTLVEGLNSISSVDEILILLRKIKSLAIIPANRMIMRKLKLLPTLEILMEKFAEFSTVLDLTAELICSLLSDSADEEDHNDELAMFEKFMNACFKDTDDIPESCKAGIQELIFSSTTSKSDIPQVAVGHASSLHQLMFHSQEEFNRQLYSSDCVVDVAYLVNSALHLKKLALIYENDVDLSDDTMSTILEKQVLLSATHFQQLASVSLKALKDGHSDSLSILDQEVYYNSLMPFLSFLHFNIEQWSRMSYKVKDVLINHGAFHLLLHELYSAPTAKILTDDLLYTIITALYNVVLDSRLAKRFRIVVTKDILTFIMKKEDMGIKLLTKFTLSCLQCVLSRTEACQVTLNEREVNMIDRCLNGIDPFFGGPDNLITTIDNLARNPKIWKVFTTSGIASTLRGLILNQSVHFDDLLSVFMNMIPEPELFTVSDTPIEQNLPAIKNCVTEFLELDSSFMNLIQSSKKVVCQGLAILLHSPNVNLSDLERIEVLFNLKRYADCYYFCKAYFSDTDIDISKMSHNIVQLYQAKSMFYDYNRELMQRIEQNTKMPGLEYKNAMRRFCNARIVPVIKILTKLRSLSLDEKANPLDEEAIYILDKALLDFLIFNTKEVSTCLLCQNSTKKLIHSHFIPKSLLQAFVKGLGFDAGAEIFLFSATDHPSDFHFKSAAKLTFSMLCKTCDGTVLSQDENVFKSQFFNIVYPPKSSDSHLKEHVISYASYLYKFTAGLMFRNVALFHSSISAEIGDSRQLHLIMQSCREAIFGNLSTNRLKMYLLSLPLQLPSMFPQLHEWSKFVMMVNSPYGAYKLLKPGEPLLPKKVYCFMVKIGILLFLVSLDEELDSDLEKKCPFNEICFCGDETKVLTIPSNEDRGRNIPTKLWWSLLGWARTVTNASFSIALSIKPTRVMSEISIPGLFVQDLLKNPNNQPITANLLPPGFEMNFEKPTILPERAVVVPPYHKILLHFSFKAASNVQGYAVLGKLDTEEDTEQCSEKEKKSSLYSIMKFPYILIQLHNTEKTFILKSGFCIDEKRLQVTGSLPGVPHAMKESRQLKELVEQVPNVLRTMLRAKGFISIKSLLLWQGSNKTDNWSNLQLDTKCIGEKCVYCEKRCDICLKNCMPLSCYKLVTFPALGDIFCCSKTCGNMLFSGSAAERYSLRQIDPTVKPFQGYKELMKGFFTIDDEQYPDLMTAVYFSVCQMNQDMSTHPYPPASSGLKFVKVSHHCVYKPFFVEYIIDDNFNATEMLNPVDSETTFSFGEMKEMMNELHRMLVRVGIPYLFIQSYLHN